MPDKSYYENELRKINTHRLYAPKVQFINWDSEEGAETEWIDLNNESAQCIIDFLRINFPETK